MVASPNKGFSAHAKAAEAHAEHHHKLRQEHHARQLANANYANYGGVEGFYGGVNAPAKTVFVPGKRRRINLVAVCINAFLPFLMFATLYCVMSFKFHYQSPNTCWMLAFAMLGISLFIMVFAIRGRKRDREPKWLLYTSCACISAVVLATVFGNLNYVFNLLPYYEIDSLNTYPSVNPANDYGQEMMDAGRIYFADGTGIDMKKATSFKNVDLYCVAPITSGTEKLSHYDFWAVGKNCCSGVSPDFRCGQFNNPKARSGLRQIGASERPFYRLAVQMASAQFALNAPHPLFFQWIQDPVAELSHYLQSGWRFYLLGVSTHFAINLICCMSAMIIFSKIGGITGSSGTGSV